MATGCRAAATGRPIGKTEPDQPPVKRPSTAASADRLAQAEALWAMLTPTVLPGAAIRDAWRNVLLYSEHTWGAHCSISKPEDPFTTSQWETKQAFADEADRQSRAILAGALSARGDMPTQVDTVDVFNTTQWPRTDLVALPKDMKLAGERAADADGRPVPTQRLASGELVFLAKDVPAFGAKRLRLLPEPPKSDGGAGQTAIG